MKILSRIVVAISIVGLSLLGAAPNRAQAIQPDESRDHELYLPYVINSHFSGIDLYAGFCIDSRYLFSDCILGKIINHTHKTVYNVSLTADVFENGVLTQTYTSTTMLPANFPGGTNPIQFSIDSFVDYNTDLSVRIESFDDENEPEYLPLTVESIVYDGSLSVGVSFFL